jgi:hypothetical protein
MRITLTVRLLARLLCMIIMKVLSLMGVPSWRLLIGCHGLFNREVHLDARFNSLEDFGPLDGDEDQGDEDEERPSIGGGRSSVSLRHHNFMELLFAGEMVGLIAKPCI